MVLLTIAAIFAFCAVIAAVAEAIEQWGNRRSVRRRAERLARRREAHAELDEAINYQRTFAPSRRVW